MRNFSTQLITALSFVTILSADEDTGSIFGWFQIVKLILLVGVTIGGLFLILWLVNNYQLNQRKTQNTHSYISIIESRPLSPKSQLHVIQVQDEVIICAETQHNISVIHKEKNVFKTKLKNQP
jgi:flagellar biogenesis protein FliO